MSLSTAIGLIALANLKTITYRTALTGTASFLDVFVLAPGLHYQQSATEVNGGEYPTVAAMTTGYVFRVENEATVAWLQRIGRTGHLTQVSVTPPAAAGADTLASAFYMACVALTVGTLSFLWSLQDRWALGALGALMLARLLNTAVLRRRAHLGWKGAPEPGVRGDLLVLLSQDRWVRVRGLVDDLKTVTSGAWLRDASAAESAAANLATVLVYAAAGAAMNASPQGGVAIAALLLASVALLGACNAASAQLRMFGRALRVQGEPKAYRRRADLAEELLAETGKDHWAIALGLIVPSGEKLQKVTP